MSTGLTSAYIGAYLCAFLYGAYIAVAYHCSAVMYHRYKARRLHMYLLGVHITLFILITWRSITTMARTLNGVIHLAPSGTIDLHPKWSTWSLVENVPWALTTIVADAFLVYRTYIVWSQRYLVIIIPLILYAADVGAMIYVFVLLANSNTTVAQSNNVATVFAAVTLSANIVCTALISFRIWTVQRNLAGTRQGSDPLSGIVALIVESAAIYTVVLIPQIVTLIIRIPIYYAFFDIQAPVIGIVFSMIIIRVSRGEAYGDTNEITDDIAWHRSTTENTASNVEIRLQTTTSTHSHDVEAQHGESKASTETNPESPACKA
ncbi:uncharacterized protein EV420DRAFT_1766215 [Desarmillaria tabescens]|uniref:Uncharacterized protein n=1 Tax=Armillaria tabescens TaxID=1929756 RepID=A0AA39K0N5_ARMTA|nr:uncharacterized protein EV420DRAFT_1766215 [Desarmillaria tabescens]KAK0452127.1 hypothetical protein EV420DRAFT_1766215 [Desarmillaria tabescens]